MAAAQGSSGEGVLTTTPWNPVTLEKGLSVLPQPTISVVRQARAIGPKDDLDGRFIGKPFLLMFLRNRIYTFLNNKELIYVIVVERVRAGNTIACATLKQVAVSAVAVDG